LCGATLATGFHVQSSDNVRYTVPAYVSLGQANKVDVNCTKDDMNDQNEQLTLLRQCGCGSAAVVVIRERFYCAHCALDGPVTTETWIPVSLRARVNPERGLHVFPPETMNEDKTEPMRMTRLRPPAIRPSHSVPRR
jgi:hypothetical protein